MSSMRQLEKRIGRLEGKMKKVWDILELSSITNPLDWKDLTELDKRILRHLLTQKHAGATTTEVANALQLDKPEQSGRTIVWRRLKRIQRISKRMKGSPIVICERKRWVMNYDEFTFSG